MLIFLFCFCFKFMVAGVDGVPGKRVRSRVEGDIIPVNGRAITPHQITAEIIAGDYQTKPWPVTRTAVQVCLIYRYTKPH